MAEWSRARTCAVSVGVSAAVALVAGLFVASCSTTPRVQGGPPVTEPIPASVLVALGGNETLNPDRDDIADDWTQLVFADALPAGTVYVNLATRDATVDAALAQQLPQARDLHPTVAMVWLGSADVARRTPPDVYAARLTKLVEGLRDAGATKILLLSPSTGPDPATTALAGETAAVAASSGATLVDLGDVSDRADDAGQRHIADAVVRALG